MISPYCERAIADILSCGRALFKIISPNDTGLTGSHQAGYYLPKNANDFFSSTKPIKGINKEDKVKILWQNGNITKSHVKWYGKGTRSEYRLTTFGRDFPYLTHDHIGDLLILVFESKTFFKGYVLFSEDDIEEIINTFNLTIENNWCSYQEDKKESVSSFKQIINTKYRKLAEKLDNFPDNSFFSENTWNILSLYNKKFTESSADSKLLKLVEEEFKFFKIVERKICDPYVHKLFKDIDDFLKIALQISNRRKTRAGRALENHVDMILKYYKIPHEMRPNSIDGKPDIVIPDASSYFNKDYPQKDLFVVGVKTTCKDRWRQILNEAKMAENKYLLTLQSSISQNQLAEMQESGLSLVVPKKYHSGYPNVENLSVLSMQEFVDFLADKFPSQ